MDVFCHLQSFSQAFFSEHKTIQTHVATFNCEQLDLTLFYPVPPVVTASLHHTNTRTLLIPGQLCKEAGLHS